jgi:NAD(P)-dependent dehydrogenase (short-subunit alcohol dehydrogenase family)
MSKDNRPYKLLSWCKMTDLFAVSGKHIIITGGGGVLCATLAEGLAARGAKVSLFDLRPEAAQKAADKINAAPGKKEDMRALDSTVWGKDPRPSQPVVSEPKPRAIAVACNVLERPSIEEAYKQAVAKFGPVDALINGAGGNHPSATTAPDKSFFDVPAEAIQFVFNLNFLGTFMPTQVIGKEMAARGEGNIINISSMNAFRPLTRIPAYSAAKAAVSNFTQWLAVHLSQEYSKKIRVNAIAPGFFLTDQNRFLLTDKETGALTARGETIIGHTPMGRFGEPVDLLGAIIFLLSPAAEFVHGVVLPIDGGFSAFSGV